MKRLKSILRLGFLSPEFLALVVFFVLWLFEISLFTELGSFIQKDEDFWKYLLTLPAIFSGFIFAASNKIRAPIDGKSNKQLYDWSDYILLIDAMYVSFFIAIFFFLSGVSALVFRAQLVPLTIGIVFTGSLVILGICALTMLLAKQKIREILEQLGEQ